MSMVKEDMYGGDMSVLIPELLGQNFVTDDGTYRYLSTLNFVSQSAKYIAKDMWKASYLVISYLNNIIENLRYKYLADADKKNTFDIERYMKRRPAIVKPDEPFDLYELKATDLQPNNSTERKEL